MGGSRTIAVWGHYHGGNLGDDLVVETIIHAVRHRDPTARIVGVSMSPDDTQVRHGVDVYPINPEPKGSSRWGGHGGIAGARISRAAEMVGSVLAEPRFLIESYRFLRGVDQIVVAGSGQL